LKRLGRILAAALLVLAVAVPGVAAAEESTDEKPLSDVPSEYEPALDAVAKEFGVSADDLKSASKEELQTLVCSQIDDMTVAEALALAEPALAELTDEERQQVEEQLPLLWDKMKSEVCVSDDEVDDGVEEVPSRVDTGGGGSAGGTLPAMFGAVFAGLFGIFGLRTITRRRQAS
jgi:predicted RecB family endonuclease